MASFPQHLGEPGLAGVLNHENLQSVDAEQFAEEEAVKVADIKLINETRRFYLNMLMALNERLGITCCEFCGKRVNK